MGNSNIGKSIVVKLDPRIDSRANLVLLRFVRKFIRGSYRLNAIDIFLVRRNLSCLHFIAYLVVCYELPENLNFLNKYKIQYLILRKNLEIYLCISFKRECFERKKSKIMFVFLGINFI